MTICVKCEGTGFLHSDQIPETVKTDGIEDPAVIFEWMKYHKDKNVSICDCCGDGKRWYLDPGQHISISQPAGSWCR